VAGGMEPPDEVIEILMILQLTRDGLWLFFWWFMRSVPPDVSVVKE
jgi:hypothetical protein